MFRRVTCLALLLAALPGSARASVGLTVAVDAASPARTDGWKRIAYVTQAGAVQLLGFRGGSLYTLDAHDACPAAPTLVALGGGQALLTCDATGGVWRLDVGARTLVPLPGAQRAIDEANARTLGYGSFTDIGAYGARFEAFAYHEGTRVSTLDWRTGELTPSPETSRTTQDLDARDFTATLCRPLTRPPHPTDLLNPELYDMVWPGVLDAVFLRRGTGLTIERCDSRRRRVLWPVGRYGTTNVVEVRYEAGFVTWVVPRSPDLVGRGVRLHAYLPGCASLEWNLAPYAHAAHLRPGLVLSESAMPDGPWTIRRIWLRDVCSRTTWAWHLAVDDGERLGGVDPRSATLALPQQGTVARSDPAPFRPMLDTFHPRGALRLEVSTLSGIVRSVRARLGDGPWRRPVERRLDWRLSLPPVAAPTPLLIEVRYRPGGSARYVLRVAPPRRR